MHALHFLPGMHPRCMHPRWQYRPFEQAVWPQFEPLQDNQVIPFASTNSEPQTIFSWWELGSLDQAVVRIWFISCGTKTILWVLRIDSLDQAAVRICSAKTFLLGLRIGQSWPGSSKHKIHFIRQLDRQSKKRLNTWSKSFMLRSPLQKGWV